MLELLLKQKCLDSRIAYVIKMPVNLHYVAVGNAVEMKMSGLWNCTCGVKALKIPLCRCLDCP